MAAQPPCAGPMASAIAKKRVPGMPADVLIITGERTVLAYFLGR